MNNLSPGFQSELEAQICFRAVLKAFSMPGHVVELPIDIQPPDGLSIASAALLLTLADTQTKIALPDNQAARDWLTFHTGAPASDFTEADFYLATSRPALSTLKQGTDEEPEASATLILEVERLEGACFRLSGPGLKEPVTTTLPLDAPMLSEWQVQSRKAPCGVDIILCAGRRIIALPRSLHIEEG